MNRLVIIGNGFDLAHGLPTSYKDFIDDYWKSVAGSSHNDEFISFQNSGIDFKFGQVENLDGIANFIMQNDEKVKFSEAEIYREYGNNIQTGKYPREHVLIYKNEFFRLINKKIIQNWVDIENEYYKILKGIVNLKATNTLVDRDEFEISRKGKITKLNNEFEQVKCLLEKYLREKVVDSYNVELIQGSDYDQFKFCDILRPISVLNKESNLDKEFSNDDFKEIENQFDTKKIEDSKGFLRILNFNYTPTALRYLRVQNLNDNLEKTHIPIHGILGNKNEHKINFGFGDEMDEDYKIIENLDDNEYLKNFKSFQYLQNSNYKTLLDYIDMDKFQVLILGHSCGLSDRTLLNTVFEHINCRSIKVFYHETIDLNGKVIKDNYTEIIQNISRHFNKKKLMREKIVNKTLCQPLPQIQLPKK
jgi:hypothetical protein